MAAQGAIIEMPTSRNLDPTQENRADGAETTDQGMQNPAATTSEAASSNEDPAPAAKGFQLSNLLQSEHLVRWSIRFAALAVGVLAWHWATTADLNYYINFQNVPEPLKVWNAFLAQVSGTEFYIHILVSMQRILIGYAFAVAIGIGLDPFERLTGVLDQDLVLCGGRRPAAT